MKGAIDYECLFCASSVRTPGGEANLLRTLKDMLIRVLKRASVPYESRFEEHEETLLTKGLR